MYIFYRALLIIVGGAKTHKCCVLYQAVFTTGGGIWTPTQFILSGSACYSSGTGTHRSVFYQKLLTLVEEQEHINVINVKVFSQALSAAVEEQEHINPMYL
jgi:hypothetical protein